MIPAQIMMGNVFLFYIDVKDNQEGQMSVYNMSNIFHDCDIDPVCYLVTVTVHPVTCCLSVLKPQLTLCPLVFNSHSPVCLTYVLLTPATKTVTCTSSSLTAAPPIDTLTFIPRSRS